MRSGCATLVALNKWDVGADSTSRTRRARLAQAAPPAPAGDHLLGAHRAAASPKLLERAIELADRARRADPDPGAQPLRRRRRRRAGRRRAKRGKRLRLYYAAQVGRRPPRFAIQVNDRRLITRDWAYHLENRLRERYGLEGVPLVIDFVPKKRRARARGAGPGMRRLVWAGA